MYPLCLPHEDFEAAIVGRVESQHALGVLFECATIRIDHISAEMARRLRLWVGIVDCYDESWRRLGSHNMPRVPDYQIACLHTRVGIRVVQRI